MAVLWVAVFFPMIHARWVGVIAVLRCCRFQATIFIARGTHTSDSYYHAMETDLSFYSWLINGGNAKYVEVDGANVAKVRE